MEQDDRVSRRLAFRHMLAAASLATSASWVKPSVSSIVLPAHAATTTESGVPSTTGDPVTTGGPVTTPTPTTTPLNVDSGGFSGTGPLPQIPG